MSVLTSRPNTASVDVRDLVEDTDAEIYIVDNTTIDPPIFSLSLVQANQKQIPLLLKAGDQRITLFDLMSVLDQLGFHVDYHEIR